MTRNAYQPDTNRIELVTRSPRPSRSHAAFAGLSDEALEIAQGWYDERSEHVKKQDEIRARLAEQDTPEAQAARVRDAATRF